MNTRLTIDFHHPELMKLLRLTAAHEGKSLREIIIQALEGYFSSHRENRAIAKLAEKTFADWDNPKDAKYDDL